MSEERYKKLKVLGKGSFGKAYLIEKPDKSLCVIKQMEMGMMSDEEKNAAVLEAKLLQRMQHPNIIKFHEVFATRRNRLCIVMDFADGGDLHQFLKKQEGKLLSENQILIYFIQAALGLKHVHERKVLHRDLKAQNIFLTSQGIVMLGDFGIARVLEATKDFAKTLVGTPYYLSPEIIAEKPYGFKSDIWALGVILYEMTTLNHPFDADSLHYLAMKILKGCYPPPAAHYSEDLKNLIASMLNIEAEKRPSIVEILRLPFLRKYVEQVCSKLHLDIKKELELQPVHTPMAEIISHEDATHEIRDKFQDDGEDAGTAHLGPKLNAGHLAGGARVSRARAMADILKGAIGNEELFEKALREARDEASHGGDKNKIVARLVKVLGEKVAKSNSDNFIILLQLEDVSRL